jgi:RNA polymerase sigma-70 factor, ECF subfamily
LLDAYGRELAGVAFLIIRNHADAEEVVMDTLVTAWRRAADLRDDGALRTWLLRIATRHALSRRRRRRHTTTSLDLAMPLAAAPLDGPSADRVLIAQALVDLPPKMRAAVALHYYAGFTVPQVAEIMGASQNTIKSNLADGMARLRAALDVTNASAAPSWRRGDA